MIDLNSLLTLEEKLAAGASLELIRAQGVSPDHHLFDLVMKTCDARRAEFLLMKEKNLNPMLQMRTLMFRGKFEKAKKIASSLRGGDSGKDKDALKDSELMIEEARILAYEGDWKASEELCTQAIESSTAVPGTLLSLFQVRALARLELGLFSEALRDLNEVDALIEIFPRAQSGLYCKVLRIRLNARCGDTPNSYEVALEELKKLTRAMDQQGLLNADYLLAILMAEVEIRRFQGSCIASAAAACFRLSELMGDRLYAALALVSVLSCGDAELHTVWSARKESDISEFVRVKRLWEALKSSQPPTDSVRGFSRQSCGRTHTCLSVKSFQRAVGSESLLVPMLDAVVKLSPWEIRKVQPAGQAARILHALENDRISREHFCKSIWRTRYAPNLHDSLIWTATNRFTKKFGVGIESLKEGLELQNAWIVKTRSTLQ